jgi:TolA-binding protein
MNPKVRLALYLVLGIALAVCVRGFMSTARGTSLASSASATNVAQLTNATVATNPPVVTNAVPATSAVTSASSTNSTNATGATANEDGRGRKSSERTGQMMSYGVAGFFALIGLSVLIGYDVSRYFANRFEDLIFNDDLKGVHNPDYEEAEEAWKRGDFLDAIQLMRDYYKRNPREAHVALRIAEIYEENLGNYLAAALEYEEVLKKRLPAERWGWAAIHLANLYSGKLNKSDSATKLLHRIANEYGQTAAAKKARERLGIPEPLPTFDTTPATSASASSSEAGAPEPPSNLPPGFRPK